MNALETISTVQLSEILGMAKQDILHAVSRNFCEELKSKTITTFLNHDGTVNGHELPRRESLMLFRDDLKRFNTLLQFWAGDSEVLDTGKKRVPRAGLLLMTVAEYYYNDDTAVSEARLVDLDKECADFCKASNAPVLFGDVGGLSTRYPQLLIDDVVARSTTHYR